MRKKVKRYECIGGPMDGRKIPGNGPVVFVDDTDDRRHFYRLCTVKRVQFVPEHSVQHAVFYHYLGERCDSESLPTLIPHRRMFK